MLKSAVLQTSSVTPRRHILTAVAATAAMVAAPRLRAQQVFPWKPIRLVSAFAPGGGTDTIARLLAQGVSATIGQPMIVENRPGADGAVGANHVARAEPDGHTLLLGSLSTIATLPHVAATPYDPIRDFTAVMQTTNSATILAASAKSPIRSVEELLQAARRQPGKLNYGYSSASTMAIMELFKQMTGVDMLGIAYKGTAPVMQAMMTGEIDITFGGTLNTVPLIKQGVLRGLGTAGAKRTPLLPDVPTVAEAGVPGFVAESWNGVFAPAGTPAATVRKLAAELNKALSTPSVRSAITADGALVASGTPEQFAAFVAADVKRWGAVLETVKAREKR